MSPPLLQTADTLAPRESSYAIGLSLQGARFVKGENEEERILQKNIQKKSLVGFSAGVRHGITNQLDIGAEFSFPGRFFLDAKYGLFKDSQKSISSGFGLGYIKHAIADQDYTITSLTIPAYYTTHFNSVYSLTGSLRIHLRNSTTRDNLEKTTTTQNDQILTASLGLRHGDIHTEVSLTNTPDHKAYIWNFLIGLVRPLKLKTKSKTGNTQ